MDFPELPSHTACRERVSNHVGLIPEETLDRFGDERRGWHSRARDGTLVTHCRMGARDSCFKQGNGLPRNVCSLGYDFLIWDVSLFQIKTSLSDLSKLEEKLTRTLNIWREESNKDIEESRSKLQNADDEFQRFVIMDLFLIGYFKRIISNQRRMRNMNKRSMNLLNWHGERSMDGFHFFNQSVGFVRNHHIFCKKRIQSSILAS